MLDAALARTAFRLHLPDPSFKDDRALLGW